MGLERVYALMKEFSLTEGLGNELDVYVMPLGEKTIQPCFQIADVVRGMGYSVDLPYKTGKLGSLFKRAERKKPNSPSSSARRRWSAAASRSKT